MPNALTTIGSFYQRRKGLLNGIAFAALTSGYFAGMALFCGIAIASKDLPNVEDFWKPNRPVSVQIVDRWGRDILVRGAAEADRVQLEEVPGYVPAIIIAVEDKRYYSHVGIDPIGLMRAVYANLRAGHYVQGGSTITQQLVKNVFLSPNKTLKRKAQEMMLAVWLEQAFTKDEILEMYLSRNYFGSGTWGLEAASRRYLGKPAAEISIPETAMLAGLLKAPTRYNPVQNSEKAAERTATVLGVMREQRLIDQQSYALALQMPIRIKRPNSDNSAQYFVDWIWPELEARIGTPSADVIIRTTLDFEAQSQAQSALINGLDADRHASQGAIVTLDGTGGVVAMVGGTSYTKSQFNRAVQARRQPGSAFKTFVYLAAFRAGLKPWNKRVDEPIEIGDWAPGNFSNKFNGEMRLEDAFAKSVNTIAVKLGEEVGAPWVIRTASDFGFDGLEPLRSLPLGAQATSPLDLTAAYVPFSNWGEAVEPYGILSISTASGTPLYDRTERTGKKVLTPENLGHMNRILTHVVNQGTGGRAKIAGRDIGGKTGTTNDYRDAWFIGYSSGYVTGIWTGSDDYTPMERVTGGSVPAEIWQAYMQDYLTGKPNRPLPRSKEPLHPTVNNALDRILDLAEESLPETGVNQP